MRRHWDLILVGAGLANGLIAWRLRQRQPQLKVLMLEAGPQAGGNHTWSFHQADLRPEQHAWIAPLVAHRWEGYDVRFPQRVRTLPGGYLSVSAERFAQVMRQALGENLLTGCPVAEVTPAQIQLVSGETFSAATVIDGRGYQPDPALTVGFQAFLGQQWQLSHPHGLTRPILMDATVDQLQGFRFIYTLPLSADTLLIEDTRYTDGARLDAEQARQQIARYAERQGWLLDKLQREEHGSLAITLSGEPDAFWAQRQGQPCSGLRAGLFHPTTGYSLPQAVALAERIAAQSVLSHEVLFALIQRYARRQWQQQRFFRILNRMLFLAGQPDQRWQVMQHFYRLDEGVIDRFYAGQLTLADKARILTGKPPVPVRAAIQAILKLHSRLRAPL
ncbi:lycopene beta-cyclase CrtY [[Erwinia] mediterraneensis]|uniref:lycopene beta-cyclase CrtY n=1 Tax=[Erwinia] mediterraneensis TaxID=2161819 RepID=UPI00102FD02E|nr:lycopene beta-cyclase CrtY [[Erwinia] mediterraneensis]